jgi:hypothetical protein
METPRTTIRGFLAMTCGRISGSSIRCPEQRLLVIQKSSTIILTITFTKTSKSETIDDVSLQGIYKLSHRWVIVRTTVGTNSLKCVLKGSLVQALGVKTLKNCLFHCPPHTCWAAVMSISHPFCEGGR